MSSIKKMSDTVKNSSATRAETNYMGGVSYRLNPLETMKMMTASSIMGEPQYYRRGEFAQKGVRDGILKINSVFAPYLVFDSSLVSKRSTSEVMEQCIDAALDYDFEKTLQWAEVLRKEYFMRLNPQVIMVRAAIHPKRQAYTDKHPGEFARLNAEIMSRADEPASQLTYYLYCNKKKNNIPGILKRSWAKRLESCSKYDVYKYRNANVGMIDTVRVCHANNEIINELMKTGTVEMEQEDKTWETLRAGGMCWKDILNTIKIGHMALLRNLRNIFNEIDDEELCKQVLDTLKRGVKHGKQFPFRYQKAYQMIKKSDIHHKPLVLDALEECMDISCDNMPKLKGKTCCLSDNSGSAWGAFTSEYGKVTIAEIDNLSSVITARNSDEGYVGKFGDELHMIPVSKRNGVLTQTEPINQQDGKYHVGGGTENGVWLFFDKAIREKEHWDNIFIYSDMQAGHGGLYGTRECAEVYKEQYGVKRGSYSSEYIDVAKLIKVYREQVNPKVNVFCVQTAGYNNVLVPEVGYRTSVMYGWTGKELLYADATIKLWDEIDAKHA